MEYKKDYWDNFYNKENVPNKPSNFSEFILNYIKDKKSLLDIGCGNGRDSLLFQSNGIKVISIDNSKNINFIGDKDNFHIIDVEDIDFKTDVYYARFFIHAIKEDILDKLIKKIYSLMDEESIFVFETRSTKNITSLEKKETYFKYSMGEKHFRMLYSLDYLKSKLEKYFEFVYLIEDNNLAIHKDENPYVIRGIVKKK